GHIPTIQRAEYRLFVTLLLTGALEVANAPYNIAECLSLAARTSDYWLRVNCYNGVAAWMIETGQYDAAPDYLDLALDSLGMQEEEGELLSKVLVNSAELALYQGDYERGIRDGQKALALPYNAGL